MTRLAHNASLIWLLVGVAWMLSACAPQLLDADVWLDTADVPVTSTATEVSVVLRAATPATRDIPLDVSAGGSECSGQVATVWPAGEAEHAVVVPIRPVAFWLSCDGARLQIGASFPAEHPLLAHSGAELVLGRSRVTGTQGEVRSRGARGLAWVRARKVLAPWSEWAPALLVALALTWAASRQRWSPLPAVHSALTRVLARRGALALSLATLGYSLSLGLWYIKDDSYISYRIAEHLAAGHGPVYNVGERVEVMTTFLWVYILAPFAALGWDLVQVSALIGGAATVLTMILAWHLLTEGGRRGEHGVWVLLWLATSSSVAMWATSGMEVLLAALVPLASLGVLDAGHRHAALLAGILAGVAALLRPELHLLGVVIGVSLLWRVAHKTAPRAALVMFSVGVLAVTAPIHAWRWAYFGHLLPNTFLVKTGHGWPVIAAGLSELHHMWRFNGLGVLVVLAPLAFVERERLALKGTMAAMVGAMMVYVVWVGDDEMLWYRLFLPALPMLVILAGWGGDVILRRVGGLLGIFSRPATHVAWLLAAVVAAVVAHENLHTSRVHLRPIVEHGPPSAEVYADIGRFVARHARDGETMVIQDAGLAPYVAPSVQVIDFVGLADPQVAAASHDRGLHAFVRALHPERRPEHDAAVRDYLHQRDVEWVVLLSFAIQGIDEVRAAVATGDAEHALAPWMSNETYQVGFYDDRFTDRYQHVRTWARWDRGFLSVFVRADRWPELAASFEITPTSEEPVARWGPARLLAADVASTAITDHELPVRLRWALEPTDRDLRVVLCLIGDNAEWCDPRVPGDGFWPSRTWESTTIEVETLLPLDPDVPAGTYQVAVHVEEAGAALPRDDHTHTNRWVMGEVDVRRWRPLRDPLFTR